MLFARFSPIRFDSAALIVSFPRSFQPWKFSGTPLKITQPPCRLGEDNDYVYREVMVLTDDGIADLEEKKIIGGLTYDWAGPMPDHLVELL